MSEFIYNASILLAILAYGWWIGSIWLQEHKRLKHIDGLQKTLLNKTTDMLNRY